MAQDLPGYLDLVKRTRPDDLLVVSKELDPAYEITALVVKLEREARKRPVVICERVKGTSFPALTNLHASRSRLARRAAAGPRPAGAVGGRGARRDAHHLLARHGQAGSTTDRLGRPVQGRGADRRPDRP